MPHSRGKVVVGVVLRRRVAGILSLSPGEGFRFSLRGGVTGWTVVWRRIGEILRCCCGSGKGE